jgi:hypothetical protein
VFVWGVETSGETYCEQKRKQKVCATVTGGETSPTFFGAKKLQFSLKETKKMLMIIAICGESLLTLLLYHDLAVAFIIVKAMVIYIYILVFGGSLFFQRKN